METHCTQEAYLDFPGLGSHQVVADSERRDITSDGGALPLRKTEQLNVIIRRFAICFSDHTCPDLIEHTVDEWVAQRVCGLAAGTTKNSPRRPPP